MSLTLIILTAVWSIWVIQALLSAWMQRKFAGHYLHDHVPVDPNKPPRSWPPTVVIMPFKGLDVGLEQNLTSLFTQDYPNYRLLLLVESNDDPAYRVLKNYLEYHTNIPAQLLITHTAGFYEGQKVHNQIAAIDHLLAQRQEKLGTQVDDNEAWVFADSDAIPGLNWLKDLVAPLIRPEVGMTTGYRWLIPAKPTEIWRSRYSRWSIRFWSSVASVINSSAVGFLGRPRHTRAWGGSMAIMAKTAIQGNLRSYLEGALCDDFQFGRMVKQMGLRIYFVRSCLVPTPVTMNRHDVLNFGHRQYLLTRVYAPAMFFTVLGMVSFYIFASISAWVALPILYWNDPAKRYIWGIPFLAIVLVTLWNQIRSTQRRLTIIRAMGDQWPRKLKLARFLDRFGTLFWMIIHLVIILRACFGRRMLWRGIYYEIKGPQKVERINRA